MSDTPIKLESFGITNVGYVRSNNEDVFGVLAHKQFYILADGMGGHKAGEIASSHAMQSMCASVNTMDGKCCIEDACQLIRKAIADANAKVFNAAQQHPEYAGMGTTLCCFLVVDGSLIYGHVGDSRLYRYRNDLEQLTIDHSLTNGEPPTLKRNVITRAIGNLPTILPDLGVIPIHPNDVYLLCSDGLSDYVKEAKIAKLLSSGLSLEEIGNRLVEAALDKGGHDNITLLLVKVLI